ncbi:MAG TPA: AMP-dependent synthetase [Spirochaetaceae bacterium]|jgi:long-chain acyl-CoA synthetase|nr:AMP-dependent synthetase [Spirochaetaceae bacterium]
MDVDRRFSRFPDRLYKNFRQLFDTVCDEYAGLTAMRMRLADGEPYAEWLYRDLKRISYAAARFMRAHGINAGERVAILGENRPEWCFAYIGAVVLGAVAVPLDSALDAKGVATIAQASSCRLLFHSAAHAAKAAFAREQTPGLVLVDFDLPAATGGDPGSLSWSAAIAGHAAERDGDGLPSPDEIDGDSCAVIIFTSGTTGVAKGIMLSHKGIIANVNAARQALAVNKDDVFIAILPLHHTYAATCTFLSALEAGGSITFVEKLIPTVILRHVREARVSVMIGVPLLFDKIKQGIRNELERLPRPAGVLVRGLIALCGFSNRILGLPLGRFALAFLRRKAGLSTVRLAVSGGGPLAWDTAAFYEALGLNLVQGYGMSENGPLISVNLPEYKDNRSAGLAVKYTQARIAEPGIDGVGEIQVRSPSLMLGYLDAPESSAEVFSADGWLRTGDLGYIDKRGFIFITGRSKNLIVTEGGKNVYPEEIEMKFEGSAWIKEALVLGRRAGAHRAGEEVLAVCVPDWERIAADKPGIDNAQLAQAARELVRDEVRRVNKELPQYMKIVDFIIHDEEFEKTSSRKIRRFKYRHYAEKGAKT